MSWNINLLFILLYLLRKQAELLKKGDTSDIDLDAVSSQTAQDFKDACVEELSKFKLAPRVSG